MELGYFLSSEEHGPGTLLKQAQAAEQAGFGSVLISDHFHPWLDEQGESPFVWVVIGAIGATTGLRVTTGVTCPTVRTHPVIIAQAAATAAVLMPGRFRLGVGSGENLNEHITGANWPPVRIRLEMLEEAVALMRELWQGEITTHRGQHYTVHNARIYSLPDTPPPVLVSGFGPKAIELAARIGDGFVTTKPDADALREYADGGGGGPRVGAMKVCWNKSADEARQMAHRLWRSEPLPGQLAQELPLPKQFEEAAQLVTEDAVAESIPCGPDPGPVIKKIQAYRDAGFEELYVNQIGPDIDGFLRFMESEVIPHLGDGVDAPAARRSPSGAAVPASV